MKKFIKLVLVMLLAVVMIGCGSEKPQEEEKKISVGFVTDVGGIDDKSFNQTSYEGIVKFAEEHGLVEGVDYRYLQSNNEAEYLPNLSAFAEEGVDLIVAAGFLFADAINELAASYPEQKVLIIDVDWCSGDNVQQAVFTEHEGSFLVGVVAGYYAKQAGATAVGFITGMESATMAKFESGYQAGVWAVYPECIIYRDNANAFNSTELGKTLATKQFEAGAYVLYHAAGGTGIGAIQEAAERRQNGEDVWAIGVDTDQYSYGTYGDGTHSAVLTSMMKRVDVASYNAVKAVYDGTFQGGVVTYSLADGGVGLPEENPNVSAECMTVVEEFAAKIISGEIEVPVLPVTSAQDARVIGSVPAY